MHWKKQNRLSQGLVRQMLSSNSEASPSSTVAESWISKLNIGEMKEMVRGMPEAKSCLEKADLRNLVASKFQSLEDYKAKQGMDGSSAASASTRLATLKTKIQSVLSQDRGVLNFEQYTPGKDHRERIKKLAKVAPELYDNPSITPRSKWFQHPRYRQNSQMPPYHIHFRQEMQEVLRCLYQAYVASDSSSRRQELRRASSIFHGSMRGLNGHVSIEEYACFPTYKSLHPHADIQFLYTDHEDLHQAETKFSNALTGLLEAPPPQQQQQQQSFSRDQLLNVLEGFLEFDDHLMSHLGEEEEIVVPMSLTEKNVHF